MSLNDHVSALNCLRIFLIYILPLKQRELAINFLHSAFEQKALTLPWQVRLGYTRPIEGQNTPVANRWELSSIFYF